jgi:hypothetical protein
MLLVSLHWSLLQSLPHRPFGYYHATSATTLSKTITMPCLLLLTLMTTLTHCLHSNFLAATNADRVLRPVVPLDNEEVAELRRTSTELREVVRYLKRERDLLEARQSVAEGESSRMEASLAATQRALDEARAELKRELDSKATARGEKDFTKLTAEVTQVRHTTSDGCSIPVIFLRVSPDLTHHSSPLYFIITVELSAREQRTLAQRERGAVQESGCGCRATQGP